MSHFFNNHKYLFYTYDFGDYIQFLGYSNSTIKRNNIIEKQSFNIIDSFGNSRSSKIQRIMISASIRSYKNNFIPIVVTLTFDQEKYGIKNISDYKWAYDKYRFFYKKFNRKIKQYDYICVPEVHKSGAYHFHFCLFNCAYIYDSPFAVLTDLWSHGFVYIRYFHTPRFNIESILKVSRYLTKYLSKVKTEGNNSFFYSRNIPKPTFRLLGISDTVTKKDSFSYTGTDKCVLDNISFKLWKNKIGPDLFSYVNKKQIPNFKNPIYKSMIINNGLFPTPNDSNICYYWFKTSDVYQLFLRSLPYDRFYRELNIYRKDFFTNPLDYEFTKEMRSIDF